MVPSTAGIHPVRKRFWTENGTMDDSGQGPADPGEEGLEILNLLAGRRVDHDGQFGDPLLDDLALGFEIEGRLLFVEGGLLFGGPVDDVTELLLGHLGNADMADIDLGRGHDHPKVRPFR